MTSFVTQRQDSDVCVSASLTAPFFADPHFLLDDLESVQLLRPDSKTFGFPLR